MFNEFNIAMISVLTTVVVIIGLAITILNDLYNSCIKAPSVYDGHRRTHIIIMSVFLSGYTWLVYTFMSHAGLQHSMEIHLIKEKVGYGVVVMNLSLIMLSVHLYKEVE